MARPEKVAVVDAVRESLDGAAATLLADYRGLFDWRLQLVDRQGFGFSTNLRKGGESSYGSVQVDVSYPMNELLGGNLDLFLYLQYFNGWGESLLVYDEKLPAQFRIGIALVR